MRVLVYGNVNNLPLQLAMGLRAHGVDAHLAFTGRTPLHHPGSVRTIWRWLRPRWIHDHSSLSEDDFICESPRLLAALSQLPHALDYALLNDMGPSLDRRLGLPQVFINTGSDLTFYGDPRLADWRTSGWDPAFKGSPRGQMEVEAVRAFVKRQRLGIARCQFTLTGPRGAHPAADRLFDELGVGDDRRAMWRVADTNGIRASKVPTAGPLVITSVARVDMRQRPWGTDLDLKGTDILIEGVARAIHAGVRVCLNLPRKGEDVAEAEWLIAQLGIKESVQWQPDVPRKHYLRRLREACIIADSLGPSGPGTVTHDALATGRPVLGNLAPETWAPVFGVPYPGFHATSPETVEAAIHQAAHDRKALAALGAQGRQFAEEYLSLQAQVARLTDRISASVSV